MQRRAGVIQLNMRQTKVQLRGSKDMGYFMILEHVARQQPRTNTERNNCVMYTSGFKPVDISICIEGGGGVESQSRDQESAQTSIMKYTMDTAYFK